MHFLPTICCLNNQKRNINLLSMILSNMTLVMCCWFDKATPTEDVVCHPKFDEGGRLIIIIHYYMNNEQWFWHIVRSPIRIWFFTYSNIPIPTVQYSYTYKSQRVSIILRCTVHNSLFTYLQQLQFLSHVSLYFVLGIVVSGKLTEYCRNFVGSFI